MKKTQTTRFPSGRLVAALLLMSGVLWAVMFFGSLAHLQRLAGGLAAFDLRPRGYSFEEARTFLAVIGERGRAYYLNRELLLDAFFPPLYAISRALALWWLTKPGRWHEGVTPLGWRYALAGLLIIVAIVDGGVENVCIAKMLREWPNLSPGVVHVASLATRAKMIVGAVSEFSLAVLAVLALLRWCRVRLA